MILLKEQDFDHSYHDTSTDEIDQFVDTWNTAETKFLDSEIEEARKQLHVKMYEFTYRLAQCSGYIQLSVVPEAYRGVYGWPEYVDERVRELNEKSTECYKLH